MDKEMELNQALWDEWTGVNASSAMYRLDAFRQGENVLDSLVLKEMGNVAGKSLLHLQCHFGMDTLSWARLGASVTGVDFSSKAISLAKNLSRDLQIPARFIQCNIYDLPSHLEDQFDIVFASYGVLTWLPDLSRWMQIAASYVKPGGFLYLLDGHPITWIFDEKSDNWELCYPYFQQEAMICEEEGSYADRTASIQSHTCYQWQHTLGEIVTSACNNGLRIEYLHEFGYSEFQAHPSLIQQENGTWHHPDGDTRIPMLFSLKAWKN
jgi:SAM-dependent methyltransferase